jgi:hypothetical protein
MDKEAFEMARHQRINDMRVALKQLPEGISLEEQDEFILDKLKNMERGRRNDNVLYSRNNRLP